MKDAKYTKDELYRLVPAIYRQRDAEIRRDIEKKTGKAQRVGPLEALMEVIAEQVEIVQDNIEMLYEECFIETCNKWAINYIADLLGVKGIRAITDPIFTSSSSSSSSSSNGAAAFFSQRARVANTLDYRSRKGTLEILRRLARDVTGWDSGAVEFFQLLCTTQDLNHLRLFNLACISLRSSERLELIGTPPFDNFAHTADVRHIKSKRGYYNIPNIGIFLWRLQALPVINAPAFRVVGGRKFTFNQLGYDDIPLFNHPSSTATDDNDNNNDFDSSSSKSSHSSSGTNSGTVMIPAALREDLTNYNYHFAISELSVPSPIRRRALDRYLEAYYASRGNDNSISIRVDGMVKSVSDIVVCDLSNWLHIPPKGKIAIDPVLGRIAFSDQDPEPSKVYVSYYYGFSSKLGGGFYQRPEGKPEFTEKNIYRISKDGTIKTIQEAIGRWDADQNPNAIFEIEDSDFYEETLAVDIPENITLQIRAAQEQRPVIRPSETIKVKGSPNSRLILEGLLIDSASVGGDDNTLLRIEPGDLSLLEIRHCTLTPERHSNSSDGTTSNKASLSVRGIAHANNDSNNVTSNNNNNNNLQVFIDYTICGRISVSDSEAKIKINDSIIDGKGINPALNCRETSIENSTIFGKVTVTQISLASNSIFTDLLIAERRQQGCVRFSYVPPGSSTPTHYKCQPEEREEEQEQERNDDDDNDNSIAFSSSTFHSERIRLRFTSERYGDPGYAQLHRDFAQNAFKGTEKLFEGADNGAEMGVFSHLYQPQRIRDLEFSLGEYLRSSMEAGIFLAT
jgi:hypothetical protein